MKILVVDIAASEGGALTILKDFHRQALMDNRNSYEFWVGDVTLECADHVKVKHFPKIKKSPLRRLWFDAVESRKMVKEAQPDEILSLQNTMLWGTSLPQVVYVHQPLPFQSIKRYSFFRREERQLAIKQHLLGTLIKLSCKKATHVIVQTQWMKDAVVRTVNVDADKISVIRPTIDGITKDTMTDAEYRAFGRNHFIYPCSELPYKNTKLIYEAVSLLQNRLDEPYEVMMTVDGKDSAHLVHLGRCDREKVLELMRHRTLVFPSYIETVGLPLLEARALGTMILAADTTFSREVLEGYENAYFFSPEKAEELADLLSKSVKGELFYTKQEEI